MMAPDELRQTSNVIQALENLIVQCESSEFFVGLKYQAGKFLELAEERLRELIHQEEIE